MKKSKSFLHSFGYAFEGILFAFRNNRNLWAHIAVAVLVLILSDVLHLPPSELGLVVVMILIVIIAEMINTAIEEMVNLITTEHQREAKIAKDVGAGMVLVASIGAVIVGCLVFIPPILHLFL